MAFKQVWYILGSSKGLLPLSLMIYPQIVVTLSYIMHNLLKCLPYRTTLNPKILSPWNSGLFFFNSFITINIQFSSVTQSCLTLCDPMDCNTTGFLVVLPTPGACSNSYLSSQWCHPGISSSVVSFSFCLQSFPASGSFPISQFFASGGQSIGALASTSVLLTNIQDWFSLGVTGWISLQSKGLLRVFFNTTVQKHQSSLSEVIWSVFFKIICLSLLSQ